MDLRESLSTRVYVPLNVRRRASCEREARFLRARRGARIEFALFASSAFPEETICSVLAHVMNTFPFPRRISPPKCGFIDSLSARPPYPAKL